MTDRVIRLGLPALALAWFLGGTWPPVSAAAKTEAGSRPTSLAVDATDGSLVKVEGGLFRSVDRGQTWHPLALPAGVDPSALRHVATTAAAPSSLFVAGPGAGVLRSDDRGKTWRALDTGLPSQEVEAFAVHTFRPDTLYVWIKGRGIVRTEDGGKSWQRMDDGPPSSVAGLAHSTLEGSMNTGWLYAATPGGPYLSMDCF